jgi:hypothetical protein
MSRKWIAIASGKGGVGKSVVARIMGELIRHRDIPAWIMDGDGTVGQTLQYLGQRDANGRLINPADQDPAVGVGMFNLHAPGDEKAMQAALERITLELAPAPNLVLLDLPAGSLDIIAAYQRQSNLVHVLIECNWDPVLVIPITPYKASRRAVANALALGAGFKLVAIRSEWFGDDKDYGLWIKSDLRKRFLDAGGVEVLLPRLRPWILAQLDENDITFHDGIDKVSILDRQTLANWVRDAEAAILTGAGDVLGLSDRIEATSPKAVSA